MKERKVERTIGIDVLRILLAFMVLTLHFNGSTTGAVLQNVTFFPVKVFVIMMEALCYPAVNCYVIISGFFSYKKKKRLKEVFLSLAKLYICLLTFSLVGYMVGVFAGNTFCFFELINRCFPLTTGQWWYMSCYFAVMMLSPYFNQLLELISLRQHRILICLLVFMFSIAPVVVKYQDSLGGNYGYSLIWFVVLYFTGAYIQRRELDIRKRTNGSLYLVLYLGLSLFLQLFSLATSRLVFLNGFSFAAYNSIVVYLQAICLVFTFLKLKTNFIVNNKHITKIVVSISSLSMALYVLHCQTDLEIILWTVLKPAEYCNQWIYIPMFIVASLGLFCLSCMIEWIRRKVMLLGHIEERILLFLEKLVKRLVNAIAK